jgi:hypothetical protein
MLGSSEPFVSIASLQLLQHNQSQPSVTGNTSTMDSPKAKRPRIVAHQLTSQPGLDRLGKQAIRDEKLLLQHRTLLDLLRQRRGQGNLTTLQNIAHPARHLVHHLATTGAPVLFRTPPWTQQQKDDAIARGPHQSSHQYVEFLREELADMVDRATWLVLPYHRLRELRDLRVSPMGVVPQHERRPRPIVDYTFSGVNTDTIPLSPAEAMQFGRALERIIANVVHSDPKFGPVRFLKIDIADGFYRVWLRVPDIPKLAVSIPSLPGEPALVALPLSLPMGWTQSPPLFSAVTETIADVANMRLRRRLLSRPHRFEALADSTPPDQDLHLPTSRCSSAVTLPDGPPSIAYHRRRLEIIDVFVDDFIGAAQGGTKQLQHVRRILMTAIDDVFRPLHQGDPPDRTEPISTKKLMQGDACWATCKKVLGWIIDSVAMTITLPERRLARLAELLASIPPTQKRLALKSWQRLIGELRSMAVALPGARGLFSHLQAAVTKRHKGRLRLTAGFHAALDDFRWLQTNLGDRPTRLFELVPTAPILYGTHDASGSGAGGVWLPEPTASARRTRFVIQEQDGKYHRVTARNAGPIVWRQQFPASVTTALVTHENPHGTINNSELELVGSFLHNDVAAQCFDTREKTTTASTDNLSTLYWSRKGSVTTTSPTATILRQQGLHQRFHRYVSLKHYIPGPKNALADDASRLFHLPDLAFLTYFNRKYPQALPWRLYQVHPNLLSSVIYALHNKKSPREWFLRQPAPPLPIGASGRHSASPSAWILPYKTQTTQFLSYKSSLSASDTGKSTPHGVPSADAPWKVPYEVLAKRSRVWGPLTHVLPCKVKSTSVSSA